MTSQANQQSLVLRDGDGNFYILSAEQIQSARVPADKQTELQQALQGQDVAGFLFNFGNTANFAAIGQANNQSANNVVAGFYVGVGSQTALNLGSNAAGINQSGAGRPN